MATFSWESNNIGAMYTPNATQEQLEFANFLENIYGVEVLINNQNLLRARGLVDYGYVVTVDYFLTTSSYYSVTGNRIVIDASYYGSHYLTASAEGSISTDGYDTWGYISNESYTFNDGSKLIYKGYYDLSRIYTSNTSYGFRKNHEYLTGGNDTFHGTNLSDNLDSGFGNDVLYGNGGDDTLSGGSGSDIIFGGKGSDKIYGESGGDSITPGKNNDYVDGGLGIDEVWFSGKFSDYQFLGNSYSLTVIDISSGFNDGVDTLKNIENLRFSDGSITTTQSFNQQSHGSIDSLTGLTIGNIYNLDGIKDYDGNHHGYLGSAPVDVMIGYKFQGFAYSGDSRYKEGIFTNKFSGRWATVEDFADDKIDFSYHGKGGATRIVGIYQDPLVSEGVVEKDSVYDGSRTFINDLKLDNLILKHSGDFDGDGFQEIYFSKVDNTAYLRAVMHLDSNIQYANYQNLQQMTDYLTGHGFADTVALIA